MWVNSIKLIVLSLDAKQMLGGAGGLANPQLATLQAKGKKGKKHEDSDDEEEEEPTKPAAKAKAGPNVWSKCLFVYECNVVSRLERATGR